MAANNIFGAPVDGFAGQVASQISAFAAERARDGDLASYGRRAAALRSLAAYASAAGDGDEVIRGLAHATEALYGDTTQYRFGAKQRAVLEGLGMNGDVPPGASEIIAALLSAALLDVKIAAEGKVARAESLRDGARKTEAAVRAFGEQEVAEREKKLHAQNLTIQEKDTRIAELEERLEQFTTGGAVKRAVHAITAKPDEPAPSATTEPTEQHVTHKAAVPGKPGVYFKVDAKGELYGFGARVRRPGKPGKTDDAKRTFASAAAAEEWREKRLAEQNQAIERKGGSVAGGIDGVMEAIR